MKNPAVYILASKRNGTLYIGVTSDLIKRVWQHREGLAEGFTKKYGVKRLVWFEQHETMETAIAREKALKKWRREWKIELIEKANANWRDLWPEILGVAATDAAFVANPAATPEPDPSVIPVSEAAVIPSSHRDVIPANAGIHKAVSLPKGFAEDKLTKAANSDRQPSLSAPSFPHSRE